MKHPKIAENLIDYLDKPDEVVRWIKPQAIMLTGGRLTYTGYYSTGGGGLLLRDALAGENPPHPESILGLFERFDKGSQQLTI